MLFNNQLSISSPKSITMKKLFLLIAFSAFLFSSDALAQKPLRGKPNAESMPEYVVIRASDSGALSKMQINIQIKKKSRYRQNLLKLEDWLYAQEGIRATSDLMNVLFELGYEYQNAYLASNNNGNFNVDYNLVFRNTAN